MSVNREKIKQLIDLIPDQDAAEVLDFIEYINWKREREKPDPLNADFLSKDENLIEQINLSQLDRQAGRVYEKEEGLDYLRKKVKDFERGQNL
ncbi:hypothetical protein [Salibacterium halotolerans]|uniref:DUF2281 domain-containing protein n=1 Tax=Salibacterium halotolerans TaxID=1884432 RepID=A0A1I5PGF2_9BACI|nr:hypothetical protein [Salibacterium halotolerans]SFP33202.1 hypothetical protein SAMN05518683_104120 [Salibacterium halotolerans]